MNQQTRNYLLGAAGLVIIAGLIWWGQSQKTNNDVIKVGGAFALTGFGAEWGEADRNGVQLAIDEVNTGGGINNRMLELVVEDIASDGAKTVSAVQKLLTVDNVDVIIGPTWLDSFTGAAPLADQHQVVMIAPSASITAVQSENTNQYVFSTWFRSDQEVKDLAQYLGESGRRRIALFFGNDPFWQDTAHIIKGAASTADLEVVADYKFNAKDVDFRTPLSQLAKVKPDAIVFGFDNENQFASFLKQRRELHSDSQLVTTEYVEEFALQSEYNDLLLGTEFVAPEVDINDFSEKYLARFQKEPIFGASNAYDAMNIVVAALKAGKIDGPEMEQYIRSTTFDTVTFGTTGFDEIGGVQGSRFVIKRVGDDVIDTIQDL